MNCIEKILSISSDPIVSGPPSKKAMDLLPHNKLGEQLGELLANKNGFFAFESALHLFPLGTASGVIDLEQWNSSELWRNEYGELANDLFFFAEDIFGCQFCFSDTGIGIFEPETGAVEHLADSLEEWAKRILEDYNLLTGYPIAHEWQLEHGPLPENHRLIPLRFFVTGGKYALDNLKLIDSVDGMKIRGNFAQYIKDLPDGATIEIKIVD